MGKVPSLMSWFSLKGGLVESTTRRGPSQNRVRPLVRAAVACCTVPLDHVSQVTYCQERA